MNYSAIRNIKEYMMCCMQCCCMSYRYLYCICFWGKDDDYELYRFKGMLIMLRDLQDILMNIRRLRGYIIRDLRVIRDMRLIVSRRLVVEQLYHLNLLIDMT